jgi:hypothetical protein
MLRLLPILMLGAVILFPLAGCGQSTNDPVVVGGGCNIATTGKLLLLWTVRGQPATATSCSGIASLDLVMTPDGCGGGNYEIEPIEPCARNGVAWRYDNLPVGASTLSLAARDAAGHDILAGTARVTLTPSLPADPAPIDLE